MATNHARPKAPTHVHPQTARIVGGIAPPPSVGAPTPPQDPQTVSAREVRRVLRPRKAQLDVATTAADELRRSTSFAEVVAPRMAEPAALADAIELASDWSAEVRAAEVWLRHAKSQATLAWHGVLTTLDRVHAPLRSAAEADPVVEQELASFTRLVTARSDAARRANVTKRAKKAAEAP